MTPNLCQGFVVTLIPTTETSLEILPSVLGQTEGKGEKPSSPVGLCVKVSNSVLGSFPDMKVTQSFGSKGHKTFPKTSKSLSTQGIN